MIKKRQLITLILVIIVLISGLASAWLFISLQETQVIKEEAAEIAPSCPAEGAFCKWSPQKGEGIVYEYKIIDITKGGAIIIKSGRTKETQITFTPEPNHTYRCTVSAINICGAGPEASADNTCTAKGTPTPTPPTSSPSPTPTTGQSPTPSPSGQPTLTPSPTSTVTPTLTPGPSATPSPTESKPTNTPTPTQIKIVQSPTNMPQPTTEPLPQAGTFSVSHLIIVIGALLLITGFIL